MPQKLAVQWEGEPEFEVPFSEWLADNMEDTETIADVERLAVGESALFGGGAMPSVKIRVLA